MADSFDNILGQPQVRSILRKSISTDKITHAYLFLGPTGSNKTATAFALAQAILCPNSNKNAKGGYCGSCDNCLKIKGNKHPDVHFIEPEGTNGYLIEQIRNIVSDVSFAPIRSSKKVYILDRVDLMGTSAANAFLKVLEEPPTDVVFILLGRTRDSVLETIASRCQVIPFRHIPPSEAAGIVSQNTGASLDDSLEAIEACSGSISNAILFLNEPNHERISFRNRLLDELLRIRSMSNWEIISLAEKLLKNTKAPLDVARKALEEELSLNSDFLAKSAIRQIEAKNKRQLDSKSLEYLNQMLSIITSLIRDAIMVACGSRDLMINKDRENEIIRLGGSIDIAKASDALRKIDHSKKMLNYNVSPETIIDVAIFQVREAFNGESITDKPSVQY